jgi:hypothetical protein
MSRTRSSLPLLLAACLVAMSLVAMSSSGPARAQEEESTSGRKSVSELTRELRQWRAIVDDRTLHFEERQEAADRIEAIDDPRMTPVLSRMWDQEKEVRVSSSRRHVVQALQTIAEGGDRDAFLTVVKASIQDTHSDIRRDAAIWVGTQENRKDAIPTFVRYLNTKKYGKPALTSLGYTQIPQNPEGPPDPELVKAMIDGLVEITPVTRLERVRIDHFWRDPFNPRHTQRGFRTERIPVTEYVQQVNPDVKEFLYQYAAQYTNQDWGYDQQAWRKNVLQPLRERETNRVRHEQHEAQ